MRKLTKTEVLNLKDGDKVYYRMSLANYPNMPVIKYEGKAPVIIRRNNVGEIVLLMIDPKASGINDWADYYNHDVESDGSLMSEEYRLELFVDD